MKVSTSLIGGFVMSMKIIPEPQSLFNKNTNLLPLWLPVAEKHRIVPGKLTEFTLSGEPLLIYLDESTGPPSEIQAIYGICPHQGAYFKKGHLNRFSGCVSCPYHGFQFKKGVGHRLPTKEAIAVPRFPVMIDRDLVYVLPYGSEDALPPFQPPEEIDPAFVQISGSRIINKNCDIITENVLDMLHVSYIHYFGNKEYPLPFQISFKEISEGSGRTTYRYKAGSKSISKVVGKANEILVENEYHLPSTTITRVKVNDGKLIKTVMTRATPINEHQTVLFWKIYRNFWRSNLIEEWMGDFIMHQAMKHTLAEDIGILNEVHGESRLKGFSTIYDATIDAFRKAKNKMLPERL